MGKVRKYNPKKEAKRRVRKKTDLRKWFRETVVQTLSCKNCGFSHVACMDFHHRDPLTKIDEVSKMINNLRPKSIILEEVAKCDVLCANCNRILH